MLARVCPHWGHIFCATWLHWSFRCHWDLFIAGSSSSFRPRENIWCMAGLVFHFSSYYMTKIRKFRYSCSKKKLRSDLSYHQYLLLLLLLHFCILEVGYLGSNNFHSNIPVFEVPIVEYIFCVHVKKEWSKNTALPNSFLSLQPICMTNICLKYMLLVLFRSALQLLGVQEYPSSHCGHRAWSGKRNKNSCYNWWSKNTKASSISCRFPSTISHLQRVLSYCSLSWNVLALLPSYSL